MMMDVTVVQTKAGWVGQVIRHQRILWESEPFPVNLVGVMPDKLRREYVEYDPDDPANKAREAAQNKITEVLEGLFSG